MNKNKQCHFIRISPKLLEKITNLNNERNMYVHPNLLARDIFWQRIEIIVELIDKYASIRHCVLDLGGGSGMLCNPLSQLFDLVHIIDLDTSDAESVIKYYNLTNVNTFCEDIINTKLDITYNVIIAADVLEHFKDLNIPLQFIKQHLKKEALLFVSLPTENYIYVLGRKIIRKNKPADHYHGSGEVLKFLCNNGFQLVYKRFCPNYIFPIPLFEIAVLRKSN